MSYSALHKLVVSLGRLEISLLYVRKEKERKKRGVRASVAPLTGFLSLLDYTEPI
jgi:hypothetical protein